MRGVGGLFWRRELQCRCAGLRFDRSSARSICPVFRRVLRGMTWSTLSAPGFPHSQQTFEAASTWARMRRQGRPFLPTAIGVFGAH